MFKFIFEKYFVVLPVVATHGILFNLQFAVFLLSVVSKTDRPLHFIEDEVAKR